MTITWLQFTWGFALLTGWTGLLLGGIKYLLNRQIAAFEARLAEADDKASKAFAAVAACEKAVAKDIADIKQQIHDKPVCSNHARMEADNKHQYERLDSLNGSIQRIDGKLNGIVNTLELLLQHHIKGS